MTTVKELSDELGVSRTTILKFCKEELNLKTEPRKALQLSANQCSVIANRFSAIKLVKQEVSEKETDNTPKRDLQLRAEEVSSLQQENAKLKAENEGLREQIALYRERLEVADAALEREQMQARGFWSKLGQKLIGDSRENNGGSRE